MLLEEANMAYKDYNVMSGQGISDVEMLEAHDGPANFAGTPKVNTYMVNKTFKDNLASGMDKREANIRRVEAQKVVKAIKDQRGY